MTRTKISAAIVALMAAFLLALPAARAQVASATFQAWNVTTGTRLTPASPQTSRNSTASVEAFRNEIVSLQFAVRSSQTLQGFNATCRSLGSTSGRALPCSWVRIRYPGYILASEREQYFADPLMPSPPSEIKPNWTQGVWLTISVPKQAAPGDYQAALDIQAGQHRKQFTVAVHVMDFTLPDITQGKFYLNIWQDPAGIAREAHVPLWSAAHWKLLEVYAHNLADHGQKAITTSIIYDPWRSQTGYVFPSMVKWSFPGKFKPGEAPKFQFDFSVFDRYVEIMMKAGIKRAIQCFSMVDGPGSTSLCNIGYIDTKTGKLNIVPTHVGGPLYRQIWGEFLPALVSHLKQKGWLSRTYMGFDEKPQPIMNGIFSILKKDAPDLKISLAGGSSSLHSSTVGELTILSPELSHPAVIRRLLKERRGVGPTTFYTCCTPAMPNTFVYSPLYESRMLPWMAFHSGLAGYLRWAYTSWPPDVWHHPQTRWHTGDTFFVYPGKNGPIDSTRWEQLRQGIEDYEALNMLKHRIAELRSEPQHAAEAAVLEKRMRRAVVGSLSINQCHAHPSPRLSRREINALLAESEGRQSMSYTSNSRIVSKLSPRDFVPDANLEKEVWKTADWVHLNHTMSGKAVSPQASTEVASVWTPHYVYFAYRCKYTELNVFKDADPFVDRWQLWDRDVVEVFLNPHPMRVDHYYEFEVAPNNLWIDLEIDKNASVPANASWDSGYKHATHVDAARHIWTCVMRIPIAPMGAKEIKAGDEWRLNIFRAEGQGDDSHRTFLTWSSIPEGNSFHVPTRFGIIQFAK